MKPIVNSNLGTPYEVQQSVTATTTFTVPLPDQVTVGAATAAAILLNFPAAGGLNNTQIRVTNAGAFPATFTPASGSVSGSATVNPGSSALFSSNGISWTSTTYDGSWGTQGAPATPTAAATLTVAQLLTGILSATPDATGATHAYVLPTGTLMSGGASFAVGDCFDWSITNLAAAAADTITITAGTDHTIVGNPIIQSAHVSTGGVTGNSSIWRSRKTAATTWISYRLS